MKIPLPHFADQLRQSVARDHLTTAGPQLQKLLEAGRQWDLSPALQSGGAVSFPHAKLADCGHQIAGAVHAALDCGADQILVLGVLHPMTHELWEARACMQRGQNILRDPCRGIQGSGRDGGQEWRSEYSLASFLWMLETEAKGRGVPAPRVITRYPFLAAGHPETLPGMGELEQLARESAILVTGDLMHHGAIYGDDPTTSIHLGEGAEELARTQIDAGLTLLSNEEYDAYRAHAFDNHRHGSPEILRMILATRAMGLPR